MHYYLKSIVRYSTQPDKFIKTARNILRSPFVDTYVVSWPKTGRTWLRLLLGKVLADRSGSEEGQLLDTFALSRKAGGDTLMFSHGGRFHLFDPTHYEQLKFDRSKFGNKKIIFLTRDIRDTLVSSFFQESKRTSVFTGNIDDFVRDPQLGARKVVSFYNLWFKNASRVNDFLSVTYENLHHDPARELGNILKFVELPAVGDNEIRNAIDYASFGNMRRLEKSGRFEDSMMRPGEKDDSESLKVRRGKVGGFVDYLDIDTQDYIQQVVDDIGIAGCAWYFAGDTIAPDNV